MVKKQAIMTNLSKVELPQSVDQPGSVVLFGICDWYVLGASLLTMLPLRCLRNNSFLLLNDYNCEIYLGQWEIWVA